MTLALHAPTEPVSWAEEAPEEPSHCAARVACLRSAGYLVTAVHRLDVDAIADEPSHLLVRKRA